jgi:uncharacterized protein YndB with AHSA1/START domain
MSTTTTTTTKPQFVYVTYIASTPEKVFAALFDPEMTAQYWGRSRNVSTDWKPGSAWQHVDYDTPSDVAVRGTVLENDPPRKLVLTWERPAPAGQPTTHSRVTFLVEPFMDAVRLTMTHEDLELDTALSRAVTSGWPAILSSMKTLLETGRPLAATTRRWRNPPPE